MFSQLVKQSTWWSADYISTCIFLVCNLLLKTKIHKIPIKLIRTRVTVWPSNNSIHSFFESLLTPERNENKPNYIEKKKSTVKTRSTLGKQQARETRGGLDSRLTLDQCINDPFHQEFGIRKFDFVPFGFSLCEFHFVLISNSKFDWLWKSNDRFKFFWRVWFCWTAVLHQTLSFKTVWSSLKTLKI